MSPDETAFDAVPRSVLGKVDRLLRALSAASVPELGLSELARRSGLNKATVYRLASELSEIGLLETTEDGFALGPRLFEIGHQVPRYREISHIASPFAEDLHLATQQTVHLGMRDGFHVIYVLKVRGRRGIDKPSSVAGRLPVHCTATGRALLAASPDHEVEQVIANGLSPRTRHTIVVPNVFRGQIDRARSEGVATELEEVKLGLGAAAAPIVHDGRAVAAIGIAVSLAQGRPEMYRAAVRSTARSLSRMLAVDD